MRSMQNMHLINYHRCFLNTWHPARILIYIFGYKLNKFEMLASKIDNLKLMTQTDANHNTNQVGIKLSTNILTCYKAFYVMTIRVIRQGSHLQADFLHCFAENCNLIA